MDTASTRFSLEGDSCSRAALEPHTAANIRASLWDVCCPAPTPGISHQSQHSFPWTCTQTGVRFYPGLLAGGPEEACKIPLLCVSYVFFIFFFLNMSSPRHVVRLSNTYKSFPWLNSIRAFYVQVQILLERSPRLTQHATEYHAAPARGPPPPVRCRRTRAPSVCSVTFASGPEEDCQFGYIMTYRKS